MFFEVLPEGQQQVVGKAGTDLGNRLIFFAIRIVARQQVSTVFSYRYRACGWDMFVEER